MSLVLKVKFAHKEIENKEQYDPSQSYTTIKPNWYPYLAIYSPN